MRALVAKIDPHAAGLGFPVARSKYRHGCVVGMDHGTGHDVLSNLPGQRPDQRRSLADPFGEQRAVEADAVACIDLGLAIERQVIGKLRYRDVGDHTGASH